MDEFTCEFKPIHYRLFDKALFVFLMNQSQVIKKQQEFIMAVLEKTYDYYNGWCRFCLADADFGNAPHEEDCLINMLSEINTFLPGD